MRNLHLVKLDFAGPSHGLGAASAQEVELVSGLIPGSSSMSWAKFNVILLVMYYKCVMYDNV